MKQFFEVVSAIGFGAVVIATVLASVCPEEAAA
jgi:hypothetical protein